MKAKTIIGHLDPDQERCWECQRFKHKDKLHHYIIEGNDFYVCKNPNYKCNEYFRRDAGEKDICLKI